MKKWRDYYEILGISQDADLKEIKKARNACALLYHEDKIGGLPDFARQKAEAKMKEINEAYEILSDPDKRKRYDSEWLQRKAGTNGSQQSGGSKAMKPQPRVDPAFISFKDIAPGTMLTCSFIVYNDGGPFAKFYVDPPSPPLSWIRIAGAKSISSEQFPLQVEIEVEGKDWGKTHSTVLKVRMDDQETEVKIRLQTKSEPIQTNSVPPPSSYQSRTTRTSTSSRTTSPPRSAPTPPSYQTVPKNQGTSKNQGWGWIALLVFALVIFAIVKIVDFLEKPKVENATAVVRVQPAKKSSILKLISGGENLLIEPLDGKATTIAYNDLYFKNWLNKPGPATGEMLMDVHEMVGDGTFVQIFTSLTTDLDKIVMSQAQIARFCEKYPTWLIRHGNPTLFLIKIDGEYFVVWVCVYSSSLDVDVLRFSSSGVWIGSNPYRVVSPQLIPSAN